MDCDDLVERYLDAWNQKDSQAILKITHPQASYFDAYWGETCSGKDLPKYLKANFEEDTRWYRVDGDLIPTPNGVVLRYLAFESSDQEGSEPVLNGAEIITISDGLIMTVSDFYCDPNPIDLIELATSVEQNHGRANIVALGLSAKIASRISRRLKSLATTSTIFLDPKLTVTQLADRTGCSVMHLFHVLEEQKQTTFVDFINECRVRYVTSIIEKSSKDEIELRQIAEQSGFEDFDEFEATFALVFSMSAEEYVLKFGQ